MTKKILLVLTLGFSLSFLGFVFKITADLSNSKERLLDSPNILNVTNIINSKLLISEQPLKNGDKWAGFQFEDKDWKSIKIPTYQIVQERNFKEGNIAYYRIIVPSSAFYSLKNLHHESSLALQFIFFSRFDIFINGEYFRTYRPKNSIEANVVLPVIEGRTNLISIRGYINKGDTGIDHRDHILLGSGVELNALHSLSYKVQTVFQLVFILCKGSILLIFALVFLLLKVESSFEKFFIFGTCAVVEELIAGEYFYGPLSFSQMVYLYNFVNFIGAFSVLLFFKDLNKLKISGFALKTTGVFLLLISTLLTIDSLYWNYIVDLSLFMKFWNFVFVIIMCLNLPRSFKSDKAQFSILLISLLLYSWGAVFADNIGLNFKAYGNLLLFIMVAYNTFAIFKREQEQLRIKEKVIIEQEKDVVIGKTASILAHDIRKPLEQIKLVLDKALSGEADIEFLYMAKQDIEFSMSSINHQVNDIINYSKSSKATLVDSSFYKLLAHSLRQVLSTHHEMKIAIDYNFEVETSVLCDPLRMPSILNNLISNAVEAIRDLGGRFNGHLRLATSSDEEFFYFKIFNDGPEIEVSMIDEIFKPMFTSGKANGTGLGLASVAKSINEHNGFIKVKNIESKGVEFTISFRKGNLNDKYSSYHFLKFSNEYILPESDKKDISLKYKVLLLESNFETSNKIRNELVNLFSDLLIVVVKNQQEAEQEIKKCRYDYYFFNSALGGYYLKNNIIPYVQAITVFNAESEFSLDRTDFIRTLKAGPKILFVDDTKLFRVAWLMFHGEQNIMCVSSPEEALSKIKLHEFNFIIIDYYFSNSSMNGLRLAEKVSTLSNAKVLISSSVEQDNSNFSFISKNDYDVRKYL